MSWNSINDGSDSKTATCANACPHEPSLGGRPEALDAPPVTLNGHCRLSEIDEPIVDVGEVPHERDSEGSYAGCRGDAQLACATRAQFGGGHADPSPVFPQPACSHWSAAADALRTSRRFHIPVVGEKRERVTRLDPINRRRGIAAQQIDIDCRETARVESAGLGHGGPYLNKGIFAVFQRR